MAFRLKVSKHEINVTETHHVLMLRTDDGTALPPVKLDNDDILRVHFDPVVNGYEFDLPDSQKRKLPQHFIGSDRIEDIVREQE